MTKRMSTHWGDCWRAHHECAIAKIERDQAAATKKTFKQAIDDLVAAQASSDNVTRLLAYLGGAESALQQATVEELIRAQDTLAKFDSVFKPMISDLISRKSS